MVILFLVSKLNKNYNKIYFLSQYSGNHHTFKFILPLQNKSSKNSHESPLHLGVPTGPPCGPSHYINLRNWNSVVVFTVWFVRTIWSLYSSFEIYWESMNCFLRKLCFVAFGVLWDYINCLWKVLLRRKWLFIESIHLHEKGKCLEENNIIA